MSDWNITSPTTSNYKRNPKLSYLGIKTTLEFRASCLKQDKFNHVKILNFYVIYELDEIRTTSALVNCLFGAVSVTKNADIDKYKYSGYGIGFGRGNIYLFIQCIW